MATPLYGTENFATTLNVGGGINASQTTGIVLTSVSSLDTNGGMLGLTWATTVDASTYEIIEYGGISGNELTGVARGQNGTSGKAHLNGAVIVAIISETHNNRLADKLTGRDATAIQDPNANEIIKTDYVASAVNEITAKNAATGNTPELSATGDDTNINFALKGKGDAAVKVQVTNQVVTTSTYPANQIIQKGFSFVTWTNPSTQKSVVITFPIAFSDTTYDVMITPIGFKATDPTSRDDSLAVAGNAYGAQAIHTSASQMTVYITSAAAEANTNRLGFSWIAIGTKT